MYEQIAITVGVDKIVYYHINSYVSNVLYITAGGRILEMEYYDMPLVANIVWYCIMFILIYFLCIEATWIKIKSLTFYQYNRYHPWHTGMILLHLQRHSYQELWNYIKHVLVQKLNVKGVLCRTYEAYFSIGQTSSPKNLEIFR